MFKTYASVTLHRIGVNERLTEKKVVFPLQSVLIRPLSVSRMVCPFFVLWWPFDLTENFSHVQNLERTSPQRVRWLYVCCALDKLPIGVVLWSCLSWFVHHTFCILYLSGWTRSFLGDLSFGVDHCQYGSIRYPVLFWSAICSFCALFVRSISGHYSRKWQRRGCRKKLVFFFEVVFRCVLVKATR